MRTQQIHSLSSEHFSGFISEHDIISGRDFLGIYFQQTIMSLFASVGNSLDSYEIIYQLS